MLLYYHGSVAIYINDSSYILKDNSNGEIYNIDNILAHKGKINYTTGILDLEFISDRTVFNGLTIEYTKNEANIALYNNLSTTEFTFDPTSLKISDVQNRV